MALIFMVIGLTIVGAGPAFAQQTVSIGVLAFRSKDSTHERWDETARYLEQTIPGTTFEMVPMNYPELETATEQGKVDFVLTNSGHYIVLEAGYGVTRLATMVKDVQGEEIDRFGGVIFTRADRMDITDLNDLKGKRFLAVGKDSLGGFLVAYEVFLGAGIDPFADFKDMAFNGMPHDTVVERVLAGEFDAGTVRTDVLESMAREGKIKLEDIKVLNRHTDEEYPFLHSTELYPEWPFARLKGTDEALARKVAVALLAMPKGHAAAKGGRYAFWAVPMDYQPIHALMRKLHMGPYAKAAEFSLRDVVMRYKEWLLTLAIMGLLAAVAVAVKMWRLNLDLYHRERHEAEVLRERVRMEEIIATLLRGSQSFAPLEETLQAALDTITSKKEYSIENQGCIFLHDAPSRELRMVAQKGLAPEIRNACQRVTEGECMCGLALKMKDIVHSGSVDERHSITYDGMEGHGHYCVPIVADGEVLGVLNLYVAEGHVRNETEDRFLTTVSDTLASIICRKRSEAATQEARISAENASRTKDRFLLNMSHELRTPLNAIIGFSEMMEAEIWGALGHAKYKDYTADILNSARHLLGVISDLLDITKLESGALDLSEVDIELRDLLETCVRMSQKRAGDAVVSVSFAVPDDMPKLRADPQRVSQIVLNLLSNGIKFTPMGGRVELTAGLHNGGGVRLCVRDNGVGIAAENLPKVVEPFEQIGDILTRTHDGYGLGLPFARMLTEKHGGRLNIVSTLGKGTEVSVMFPSERSVSRA
ncbi:MAG: PhnD/SsuA/transferrin family substrate-binding protein [Alphaproteobacteria bacterium]|nr:PhnD/SsuA/transferrin family substrate-binding protein [Alphaproteobacteria bacterium]